MTHHLFKNDHSVVLFDCFRRHEEGAGHHASVGHPGPPEVYAGRRGVGQAGLTAHQARWVPLNDLLNCHVMPLKLFNDSVSYIISLSTLKVFLSLDSLKEKKKTCVKCF